MFILGKGDESASIRMIDDTAPRHRNIPLPTGRRSESSFEKLLPPAELRKEDLTQNIYRLSTERISSPQILKNYSARRQIIVVDSLNVHKSNILRIIPLDKGRSCKEKDQSKLSNQT